MPPLPTYPGVYLEELPLGMQRIDGVSTAVAAFIGHAGRGPLDTPVPLSGWADYERAFGGLAAGLELGHAVHQFFLNGGQQAIAVRVARPRRPADRCARFIGDRSHRQGLYALDAAPLINLLALPGVGDAVVLAAAAAYSQERRAFLIVDAPAAAVSAAQMLAVAAGTTLPRSDHAAVYFPWLSIADPLAGGHPRRTPPSGSIAGLYARNDAAHGVWKAPAGTETGLAGAVALSTPLSDAEIASLTQLGVNAIRALAGRGIVAWGARTLDDPGAASDFKYVPVRRLALFIEQSLNPGLQWAVFEPNGETTWARIRLTVEAFLYRLFRQGAFAGATAREAFYVRCGTDTTTPADLDRGVVGIELGFAPLKPAEFVVLRVRQRVGQVAAA